MGGAGLCRVVGLVVLGGVRPIPTVPGWVFLFILLFLIIASRVIGLVGVGRQLYYGNILVSWVTISTSIPPPPSLFIGLACQTGRSKHKGTRLLTTSEQP